MYRRTVSIAFFFITHVHVYAMYTHTDPGNLAPLPKEVTIIDVKTGDTFTETYTEPFCLENEMMYYNDFVQQIAINRGVLAQLCVQASRAGIFFAPNKCPNMTYFNELLEKIRRGTINIDVPLVHMTKNDVRLLLGYIPNGLFHAFVNHKKVKMELRSLLEPSDKENTKKTQEITHLICTNYDFDADEFHHNDMCKAFNTLIGRGLDNY